MNRPTPQRPELLAEIAQGEDSARQFKADVRNAESLASEMAAFANSSGGTIFIGVADDGATPGLSPQDVSRINQLISNAASQLVRSPLAVQTENIASHGLGSGIKRALEKWPSIDFTDDHDGCLFTATVHRKPVEEMELASAESKTPVETPVETPGKRRESVGKASGKILEACRERCSITIPELAALIGITERSIERNIQKLQATGLLRRVGGRKEGHWEVNE